jgi:uncharacterized protein with von Willebrand factor type A (vWA) domain
MATEQGGTTSDTGSSDTGSSHPGEPGSTTMQATTKLKDLAARAGRWLGLTSPPARHIRVIEADRFDQMQWRETYDQASALQEMAEDLGQTHHYVTDLLADVWTAAYKTSPQLRERDQVETSRAVNHQVAASLLDTPEFTELRRETAGDTYAAAMAVISQHDRLTRLLEQAEDAQRAADHADQAEQQAAQAAQQVADALEQAAADASEDGAVSDGHAQALQAAMQAAAAATARAEDAAQQAHAALAQAAPSMRTTLRAAAADAAEQVRADKALMTAWGVAPGQLERMDFAARHQLAQRLTGGRLGRFADLIGRFRTMATGERARKLEHGPGELVGITLGDDVGRLIPSELAALGVPALRAPFAARLAENRLMVYDTRGEEIAGKGAIIACVDCSDSMTNTAGSDATTREAWAKACALALLDQARAARRDFVGILFSSEDEVAVFDFSAQRPVEIGDVADFAEHFFGGGTDYQAPLDAAADVLTAQHKAAGNQHGDIVLITDGACDVTEDWMSSWQDRKNALAFRVFGVAVAHSPSPALQALADSLHTITDLTDPGTAREMFHTI